MDWQADTTPVSNELESEGGSPTDPYRVWGNVTSFKGFGGMQPRLFAQFAKNDPHLSVIGLLNDGASVADLKTQVPEIDVPLIYGQPIPGTGAPSRAFTARLPLRALDTLQRAASVRRFELGVPVVPRVHAKSLSWQGGVGRGPQPSHLIGIIDFGCAFLHRNFRDKDGLSRVINLWDQHDVNDKTPKRPSPREFGYGRELTAAGLRLEAAKRLAGASESDLYRQLDLLQDELGHRLLRGTHGTHVMDVAAGRHAPWTGRTDDAASSAPIAFVSLPYLTAVDPTGGSLGVYVLDGLRHILQVAQDDALVVVNVSYGTHAGPHDGTSILEQAIDELLDARPKLHVVLGAGNGYASKGHVRQTLSTGLSAPLQWKVPARHVTDSFLEIWYTTGAAIDVRLEGPGIASSPWVGPGDPPQVLRGVGPGAIAAAAIVNRGSVPNGDRSMILLALGPTSAGPWKVATESLAPSGLWTLQLRSREVAEKTVVDAWIERDDSPYAAGVPSSRFHGTGVADPMCTLSSLATGRETLVVGATRLGLRDPLPEYTASGPVAAGLRTEPSPSLCAPAEESAALRGLRAAATLSGQSFRMGGTSVAAPVVARQLYNDLAGGAPAGSRAVRSPSARPTVAGKLLPQPGTSPPDPRRGRGRIDPARTRKPGANAPHVVLPPVTPSTTTAQAHKEEKGQQ